MDVVNSIEQLPLKKHQILLLANLFFWITFAVFDILTIGGMLNGYYSAMTIRFLLHGILFAGLIYPNLYILYPLLFSKRQYMAYAVSALLLLALNIFLRTQLDYFLIHSNSPDGIFKSVYEGERAARAIATIIEAGFYSPEAGFHANYFIGITIGSMGIFFITTPIRLVEDWYSKHKLEVQLLQKLVEQNQAAAKIKEEKLKFLKAQTDPHFLINAISSVYHLALINSKQVDYALLRLSELMSYILGYGKEDFIALKHEIQFIENYIDFNNTVHQNEFAVAFNHNVSHSQMESIQIPPMLLQPFFENAFKYSNTDHPNALIKSELDVHQKYIRFSIENTFSGSSFSFSTSHGIGIKNVKERLELFLPDSYDLSITEQEDIFKVDLILFLEPSLHNSVNHITETLYPNS
ncbi:MAG: histidine kinase [Chitinophagales bacterium]|nr:histidine kinase [Chitinophagales bacterium]